jgi:hypothetical protein
MTDLPEFVYLVTVDGEWPVSAIADCHPTTPESVEREVKRRTSGGLVPRSTAHAHIWKCRLADVREVDLLPAASVKPSLRERDND